MQIPSALSRTILERAFTPKELLDIVRKYKAACFRDGHHYEPSVKDLRAYDQYLNGKMNIKQAAEYLGVTMNTVYARFTKITKQNASR